MTLKRRIVFALIAGPLVTALGFGLMILFMWSRSWLGQALAELGVSMSLGHYILWKRIVHGLLGPSLSQGVHTVVCVALSIIDYAVIAFALLSGWSIYSRNKPNKASDATSKPAPSAGSSSHQG
jgi:hypothetical protein